MRLHHDRGRPALRAGRPRPRARTAHATGQDGPPGTFGRPAALGPVVEESKANRVVAALRERGVDAHVEKPAVYQFGVGVQLPDGRRAIWDADSSAHLAAQVMRNGVLVGFVPVVDGSEGYDDQQVVDTIARTDYDQPVARVRSTPVPAGRPLSRPAVFTRFLDGFRHR